MRVAWWLLLLKQWFCARIGPAVNQASADKLAALQLALGSPRDGRFSVGMEDGVSSWSVGSPQARLFSCARA